MSFLASLQDFAQYDFLIQALIATLLLALNCGLLSPLVVARRYAFLGSALAHSTLLGLAISLALFPIAASAAPFVTTLIITLALTLFLAQATLKRQTPSDALIGIFYSVTMGAGLLIHSLGPRPQADLMGFLFGNVLLVTTSDLWIAGTITIFLGLLLWVKFSEWSFFLYDTEGARRLGLPVRRYHYLLFLFMTLVIVSSLKLAGTILVNTLLIIPGVFALAFAKNMTQVFCYSVGFSLLFSLLSLAISNWANLPIGPSFAVIQFFALALALAGRTFKHKRWSLHSFGKQNSVL